MGEFTLDHSSLEYMLWTEETEKCARKTIFTCRLLLFSKDINE
jgi:hypothetical protein